MRRCMWQGGAPVLKGEEIRFGVFEFKLGHDQTQFKLKNQILNRSLQNKRLSKNLCLAGPEVSTHSLKFCSSNPTLDSKK